MGPYDRVSPRLASLHWLPIDSWRQCRLASLCYDCLNSTTPGYLTELLKVYKTTRRLCSSSDTSILCLPSVHMHSLRDLFLMLHRLSGTVSIAKLGHQTNSDFSDHLWNPTSWNYLIDCMFGVCVHARVSFDWVLFFVMGCVLPFRETAHKRLHYCSYSYKHRDVLVWSRIS